MRLVTDDQAFAPLVESVQTESVQVGSKEQAERLLKEHGLSGFAVLQEAEQLKVVRILLG